METILAETKMVNRFFKSRVGRDYIGRDKNINYYLTLPTKENPFNNIIFLHYLGDKISNFLFPVSEQKVRRVRETNKLAFALFNNIYISLSDLIQSPFIYDDFFREVLKSQESMFTIIGTKKSQNFDAFFEEREKLYFGTGFYKTLSKKDEDIKESIIRYDSIIPKYFETKSYISCKWKDILSSYNGKIDSIQNIYLKNAIMQINSSKLVDKLILIPDKLNEMPFIWDSVIHLSLISEKFQESIQDDFELFLASEWVKCYIENLSCNIFNAMLGCNDCSLGINKCFDLRNLLPFLKRNNILEYILCLSFEELMCFRSSSEKLVLQRILYIFLEGYCTFKDDCKLLNKSKIIYKSKDSNLKKLKDEINLLFEELNFYA